MPDEMSCDRAAELMPWYLNQTLEPGEHQAVQAHLDACESCRRECEATCRAAALLTGHPPVEVILDVAEGSLAPGREAERVDAHLAECGSCREEVELARASAADLEAAVRATRQERRRRGAADRHVPGASRAWWLAAASVLIVVLSGGWWTTWQQLGSAQDRLAALEAAAPSGPADGAGTLSGLVEVPIVDLFPGGMQLRGAEEAPTVVPADIPAATLVLNTELLSAEPAGAARAASRQVALVLREAEGAVVLELGRLTLRPLRSPTISLPVATLAPGAYELLITGPESPEPLETYPLEIR
jgi:hypothetical protein